MSADHRDGGARNPYASHPRCDPAAVCTETLYQQLHRLASGALRHERPDHTLSPTALIHEAWLRLARHRHDWRTRADFVAAAAVTMRRVLVDHARARLRHKRGGQARRLLLSTSHLALDGPTPTIDLLALHEAIEALAEISPERARVVELRCFGGLDADDIAAATGLSAATVRRYWDGARAWLHARLAGDGD